jgi:hypothetical protein
VLEHIENNFLRALRPDDLSLLMPGLELWHGAAGTVLHEPGETVSRAYFPCGASLISFVVLLSDGQAIETALIGREGAAGGIVSQGFLPAFTRAEVQNGGMFLRMSLTDLEVAKTQSVSLRHLFARYSDCLMAEIMQSVACNAAHSIEQRTARWLLTAVELSGSEEITLTQDQLATMLGVGRSYLTRILRNMSNSGLIETRRGRVIVRSITGLKLMSCECGAVISRHFDAVLSGVYPTLALSA